MGEKWYFHPKGIRQSDPGDLGRSAEVGIFWGNKMNTMAADGMVQIGCLHWRFRSLTHWDRVTHIHVSKLTIIVPDNGLTPGRRQAIIWTNAGILLILTWGTNFSEILSEILTFSFKKMHLKMAAILSQPQCVNRWTPGNMTCLEVRQVGIHSLTSCYFLQ